MRTVILDFDGTIADTRESIFATVKSTLSVLNLPMADEHDIRQVIGLPLRETFVQAAHITNEAVITECMTVYRSMYNEISLSTVQLFPNVKSTLDSLFHKGITITVASSKGKESLQMLLDRLGVNNYISCIFGEQDVENKKPAPDMALHILAKTGSEAEETLVVGDTAFDIAMGQGAGCKTCGVTYGNHTREQLEKQGADYIVDDFASILDIVNGKIE